MARHVRRLKLGSKSAQFYVRFSITPLSQQANNVSSGIIRHDIVAFVCLHFHTLPDKCKHKKVFNFKKVVNVVLVEEVLTIYIRIMDTWSPLFKLKWGTHNHQTKISWVTIYIYIYIYCHPQTDWFVVSQLFTEARTLENSLETHPILR